MPACRYITLALALSLAAPTSALGEPGVTVDPRSPAGQEYAVPFEAARQLGAGQGSTPATGPTTGAAVAPSGVAPSGAVPEASTPPLFGEGVEPPRQESRRAQGQPGGERAPRDASQAASASTPNAVAPAASGSASANPPGPAAAPNVAARSMGTSALGVLLGGSLLALVLRAVLARREPKGGSLR